MNFRGRSTLCRLCQQLYDMSADVLGCCIGMSCSQPIYLVADCSPFLWCLFVGRVAWIVWPNSYPSWLCMWLFILCQLICCPSPWLVYFSYYIYIMVLLVRPCGSLVIIAWKVSFCLTVMFEIFALPAYLCGLCLSWLYRYSVRYGRRLHTQFPPHIFYIYESCSSKSFYCGVSFSREWSFLI